MKRLFSMLIVLVMVLGMIPAVSFAADFDAENFTGVVLTVEDPSFTVEMYQGITSKKVKMTPVYTDGNAYYFEVAANTAYCYIANAGGVSSHYKVRKNFYITAEDAQKKILWDVTPPVRSSDGWDPKEIWCYADATMENAFPSSPELWPDYSELLKVPALTEQRTAHKMTTQAEMIDYITGLDDEADRMYVYTLGKSGGPVSAQLDIPMVFFTETDLSAASTWQEATDLLRENGKLTVMYQAQIHGNEPAAGEAAMALLKAFDGAYGAELNENLNICVIPRLNVYGASKAARYVYVDGKDTDPNRDFLKLNSEEVRLRTQLYQKLEPEICFDMHEYQLRTGNVNVDMQDLQLSTNFTLKATDAFRQTALDMCQAAFARAEENHLGYGWYSDSVTGYNASIGTTNVAMRGSLVFLTETNGIYGGNQQLERRMMGQISTITGILDYANKNAAAVQKVVDDQRKDIVERGKTYEESDIIILASESTEHEELYINGKQISTSNGTVSDNVFTAKIYDVAARSRIAPTAYVIPAGESWTEAVLKNLTQHGIVCTKIPAGSVVQLQQYTGTATEAALTEEKAVSFPQGAYVMTMDQEDAYIMAMRMEPDVVDVSENTGTFAQQGIIPCEDGVFPIYRYIHDLSDEGFIDYFVAPPAPEGLAAVGAVTIGGTGKITGLDSAKSYEYKAIGEDAYTAVPQGSAEITDLPLGRYLVRYQGSEDLNPSADAELFVCYALENYAVFVDSVNGNASNDAFSASTATTTYSLAKAQLDTIMEFAPAGTTGVINILGTYTIKKSSTGALSLQAHDYPLLITGGTLIFRESNTTSNNANKYLRMGGDTTFDNITLQIGTNHKEYFLCADGHQLTIGENVTSLPSPNGSYYWNIMGGIGQFSNNQYAAKTDVTILSGKWRYVYAGGYVSSVAEEANLRMSNCDVANVFVTHNGHIDGNVNVDLKDVNIREGVLYCGNNQKNHIAGDVTWILRENIGATKVYAGSNKAGNINGTVTIVTNGVDLSKTTIYGKPNNTTGTIGGLELVLNEGELSQVADSFITRDDVTVVLGCDQTEPVTVNNSFYLDLSGCDASGITVAEGATLTVYDSATDDYIVRDEQGYGILSAAGNVVAKEGYVIREEPTGNSYHRREFVLDSVTLRPGVAGIYYTGGFGLSDLYAEDVAAYGVVLSLNPYPKLNKTGCESSVITDWPEDGKGHGTLLSGIMKETNTDECNAQNAEQTVYGVAYIQYKDGTVEYSGIARYTFRQLIEAIDAMWKDLIPSQKAGLLELYDTYTNVMSDWQIPHIHAAA